MMAGRRTSLVSLAGQKVDDVPGRSDPLLLSVPLDKLVPTRFNPRRRFGTEAELREFGEKLAKEQLQPAVVVSRTAYLKLWPEEAEYVGQAAYVIANGERRYRASRLVGRPALEVVHKEDVAKSRADFLDAVQSENNDRENLDPIERALGIDIMVTQLDGADPVAVYYGKTKGWVSQQRKLLKLTAELQELVAVGEMPIRVARDIAGLPQEVQAAAWKEKLEQRRLEKEAAARLRLERSQPNEPAPPPLPPKRFTAVNQPEPQAVLDPAPKLAALVVEQAEPKRFTAVNQEPAPAEPTERPEAPTAAPDRVPEPRSDDSPLEAQPGQERRQVKMPWHDGVACADIAIDKMTRHERSRMMERMREHDLAEQGQASVAVRTS
ncbi:ParB N-terminal domain-containing protein [Streptomyces sp. NPDC046862]|uniref:ParB/RepB/Spo0J family partition protein n=1 Tax=Streptomyces sp. NPDC046862 TaxID=3154603 RepID=UPI003453888E